jgi:hypothetical protein
VLDKNKSFITRSFYVYFPHSADRFNSDSGRRFANLGSQPQLGLRAQWRYRFGGDYFDCPVADGTNLKTYANVWHQLFSCCQTFSSRLMLTG